MVPIAVKAPRKRGAQRRKEVVKENQEQQCCCRIAAMRQSGKVPPWENKIFPRFRKELPDVVPAPGSWEP